MNPKIKKINAEYDKNAAKIAELQARQKELIRQRTELENATSWSWYTAMTWTSPGWPP